MSPVIIAKCCICGKIRRDNLWTEEPEFFGHKVLHSHTYCPTCLEQILEEIEKNNENTIVIPSFTDEEKRLYAIVE